MDPEPTIPVVGFSPHQSLNKLATQKVYSNIGFLEAPGTAGNGATSKGSNCTTFHTQRTRVTLMITQPEEKTLLTKEPLSFKTQIEQEGPRTHKRHS